MPLALARKRLIVPRCGPFAFPGTKPGFDPSHFAAANTRFSGVAMGGGFVDLTTGKPGVAGGAPAAGIGAVMGPTTTYTTTSDKSTFSGKPTANDSAFTFGAICKFTDVNGGSRFLISNSDASSGHSLSTSSAAGLNLGISVNGLVSVNSGFIAVANTPYFFAASTFWPGSGQTRVVNFALTNLNTGQVKTASGTGGTAAPFAPSGTYVVGNRNGQALLGSVSAAMGAASFLSIQQLQQWAADPWSYWYPRK